MPDLLLELFSEEIPALMQARAADDLRRLVTDGLVAAGLTYEGAKGFATPRRLALTVHGVTARSADVSEERKGPRVGAPAQALEGFLRGAGLASIDEAETRSDPKKGDFYVAVLRKPGRGAEDIIAELVPSVIRGFPWPKSMRWGSRSAPEAEGAASLRWVRPLRSILCTFGPETEEPVVIQVEIAGIAAGDVTWGHRFMSGGAPIRVRRFDDYATALSAAKVVLDPERRKAIIDTDARNLAFAQGLELVEDPALVEEVAGLVEWPVVLMGAFDPAFLAIPDEVIRLTIRANQKCFVLRRPAPSPLAGEGWGGGTDDEAEPSASPLSVSPPQGGRGVLANRFILTANIEASDGGKAVVSGNERVIAARLSDARFFWEQDKAVPLEHWAKKLDTVTFHEKLGSQAERVERIARLAGEIADVLSRQLGFFGGALLEPADLQREQQAFRERVELAARLAKADLTTGMVGEFPELQGVMGRYYFLAQQGFSGLHLPLEGRSTAGGSVREGADGSVGHGNGSDDSPPHAEQGAQRASKHEPHLRAIADAIRDHYKPQGPSDAVPTDPVTIAVALADKLDTLVGFWAIDEKPTGSKDPYALRRAALGVIRIVLATEVRLPLLDLLFYQSGALTEQVTSSSVQHFVEGGPPPTIIGPGGQELELSGALVPPEKFLGENASIIRTFQRDLLSFFADRLKVHLRETGARHDLIDAVFALARETGSAEGAGETASNVQDDLLMIVRRVEALGAFLDSEDGANLLTGYRRAANILRAEEKKDGEGAFDAAPDAALIAGRGQPEEQALHAAMQNSEASAREAVGREDFAAAMTALAALRPAVDAFFDKVTVNSDDPALRANRLRLLNQFRRATLAVADFSRIGG